MIESDEPKISELKKIGSIAGFHRLSAAEVGVLDGLRKEKGQVVREVPMAVITCAQAKKETDKHLRGSLLSAMGLFRRPSKTYLSRH